MDERSYAHYKELFKSVDVNDPNSLKNWFNDHPYLSIYDHAQIIGKCTRLVREMRLKAGIKGKGPTTTNRSYMGATIGPADIPVEWKDRNWLVESLKKYTASAIIRALGVKRGTFYDALKRFKIPVSSGNVSNNPCCTHAWCYRHYVALGLSMDNCAALAGISRPKFADWLVKFGIPIRKQFEEYKAKSALPIKLKRLIHNLKKYDVVIKIRYYPAHLFIKYRDHQVGRYVFKRIPPEQWAVEHVPQIKEQFQKDLLTGKGYPAHFIVHRHDLDKCTVFERDIVIHNINMWFRRTRQWLWPSFPDHIINKDFNDLLAIDVKSYIRKGSIAAISNSGGPGRKLMMHFFSLQLLYAKVFIHPDRMIKCLKSLLKSRKDFSYFNIIRRLCHGFNGFRLRYPSPAVYMVLFKRLGITGSVLDIHVGSGARAVACAVMKLKYVSLPSQKYNLAIEHGFAEYFKIDTHVWNGRDTVDCIICDGDFKVNNVQITMAYADRAKRIIVYVPKELRNKYTTLYNPKTIVPIHTNMDQEPNYFFVW